MGVSKECVGGGVGVGLCVYGCFGILGKGWGVREECIGCMWEEQLGWGRGG